MSKTGDSKGKALIAKRSFQDKYWNEKVGRYNTTGEEKNFQYLNSSTFGDIDFIGVDASIIKDGGSKASLDNYFNRHAGLITKDGAVIDLLGIRGSVIPDAPVTPDKNDKSIGTGDSGIDGFAILLVIMGTIAISTALRKRKGESQN